MTLLDPNEYILNGPLWSTNSSTAKDYRVLDYDSTIFGSTARRLNNCFK